MNFPNGKRWKDLSGRCSPFSKMFRMRSRYWCSSCAGDRSFPVDEVPLSVSVIVATISMKCFELALERCTGYQSRGVDASI